MMMMMMMMMMMQQLRHHRLMSFAARQGERYMGIYYDSLHRKPKEFFICSSFPPPPPPSPYGDDEIVASRDFQKVMNILSNASTAYQIHSRLNAIDLTNLLQLHQQHFPLKVIQNSCQTKVVTQTAVSPHNLILFIKWAWNYKTHLITTPVLEYLVSSLCSNNPDTDSYLYSFYNNLPYSQKKNDILSLWDLLKKIGQDQTGLLNTRILNKLIQFFKGKAALEVFHKFEVFQCLPNQYTYYFTLQALMRTTGYTDDMIRQAASICQSMMLLPPPPPDDDDDGESSSQDDSDDGSDSSSQDDSDDGSDSSSQDDIDDDSDSSSQDDSGDDGNDSGGFQGNILLTVIQVLQDAHPPFDGNLLKTCSYMNKLTPDLVPYIINTSLATRLYETPKVSHRNLIHFMKWVWRRRNSNESLYKDLITTPVLESLVSAVCCDFVMIHFEYQPYLYYHDVQRKNDVLFLWDFLKHIGLYQTGLLNAQILNKLIDFFEHAFDDGKAALQVFHKFEVFHCVPNQDTYYFTLQAVKTAMCSAYMFRQAVSICQKMLLHPETLRDDIFGDDDDVITSYKESILLNSMLCWFSQNKFDESLTRLKKSGYYTIPDEYLKLINTLQKLKDRKMSREKLEEMDRKRQKQ